MSSSSKHCWRRLIFSGQEDVWIERLREAGCSSWVLIERPGRSRIVLEAYPETQREAVALTRKFGGRLQNISRREWLKPVSSPPIQIGRSLLIVHEKERKKPSSILSQLYIPHGVAFGSGEHATTLMLLRALAQRGSWSEMNILDLGTGSGILALAARRLGARKIVATDFDPSAVRTARQNEILNFSTPLIRWRCADVKRLKMTTPCGLVMANLFSGILCEAAKAIAGSVAKDGRLWLSGVLRSQQGEVVAAYRKRGMKLLRIVSRGKWIMIQMSKL